jgi:hypothetical protein
MLHHTNRDFNFWQKNLKENLTTVTQVIGEPGSESQSSPQHAFSIARVLSESELYHSRAKMPSNNTPPFRGLVTHA